MFIKNIKILDEIKNVENDSIDVYLESDNGYTFTVSVATTENILQRMDLEKSNFSKPNQLVIIVRKLTQEIIIEALEAYSKDDGFWLKLHHFASDIDISVFDELQSKQVKESMEFNILSGLDDLENEINKLEKLENDQKLNLAAKIEKLAKLVDSQI